MSQGKWRNTYAATDEKEYWAIGVQGMISFATTMLSTRYVDNKLSMLVTDFVTKIVYFYRE